MDNLRSWPFNELHWGASDQRYSCCVTKSAGGKGLPLKVSPLSRALHDIESMQLTGVRQNELDGWKLHSPIGANFLDNAKLIDCKQTAHFCFERFPFSVVL